jgi:hypothetical protein
MEYCADRVSEKCKTNRSVAIAHGLEGLFEGKTSTPTKGWRPDINDGVKINIAPWERLEMFPVKKIVGNVEMGE